MTPSASATRAAQTLSRPFALGGLTVPNRIAMAPMTREFSPGGVPGADVADYYARRAAGGVGLIITEGTYVQHAAAGTSAAVPRFHGEDALDGWGRVVAAVHAAGGTIMPQLWHVGMARLAESPEEHQAVVAPQTEAGVDAFHCSTRRYWLPEYEDSDLNLAGWVKKLSGRPTITVGSVGLDNEFIGTFKGEQAGVAGIDRLLDRLERDEFDLVAIGRALLGDPEWAAKIFEGRTDALVPFDASMLRTLS
ncbi:oxidoreductase [Streptomyces nigrescens]